ncbi:hypothetical protein BDV18DRAFT_67460 [Aspergillus unguis]
MSAPRIDRASKKNIAKVQIKPLLKRASRDGSPSTSIDLSRSSFDQDGLGIYTDHERDNVQNDLYTNFPSRRRLSELHCRSTSGTSQLSTASSTSIGRAGSQYVHPMRRTPRAYTPPLVPHSGRNSYFETDNTQRGGIAEDALLVQPNSDVNDQHTPVSPVSRPRLSLHLPDTSFTPLPGASQTNITSRASFGYSRDNGSTLDTTSPASRSSLDFVFRSRTRTSMDPVSRAATVQAARQAFEEKEAAKNRKFEEQQLRAEERQTKRKEKLNRRTSVKGGDMQEKAWEKDDTINHNPSEVPGAHSTIGAPNSEKWTSQSKSTWMLFITWLRTRIFKFRRRVRSVS